MAGPPAGAYVPGSLLRRAAIQDPRGRGGAQRGDLPGAGRAPDGTRDILGLWIEGTEGAKDEGIPDLKTRGVTDIQIAVTEGLKGMPEAQGYASWKDRKLLAAAIKPIYTALSAEAAQAERDAFEQGAWGRKYRCGRVAAGLGSGDPVLLVPPGGAPGDLHDQCDWEHQRAAAQDHQVA